MTKNQTQEQISQDKLVSVAPGTKRHMLKPRAGFEPMAQLLAGLARMYPADIGVKGIDLDELDADMADDVQLTQPITTAFTQLQKLEGTRFVLRSKSWVKMLMLLERARAAGRTNPDILSGLAKVEAFMKNRRKKTTEPTPSVPTTPATTPTP